MKPIQGYHVITPGDLHWRQSNLMKIPNASRTAGWSAPGARIPARGSGGCRPEAPTRSTITSGRTGFYFVLEGTGRMRVGDPTLTVPKSGGVEWPPKS